MSKEKLHKRLTALYRSVLDELCVWYGEDRYDPNLADTPSRVAKALLEMIEGYHSNTEEILTCSFPSDNYDQMIICKDIDFYSMCSHHMLPFFGKVAVGYIPGKLIDMTGTRVHECGRVVGLSKLARIVQMYARRLQIQERMTMQIAEALNKHLKPAGVGVVVYDVKHLCMLMRGVKQHTSTMDTSCLFGEFREDAAVRQEFFSMIGK